MDIPERRIAGIYRGAPFHWVGDGFRVTNYFPSGTDFGQKISPCILLDYLAPHVFPPTQNEHRGVGPHPHRGFETVTLAFEGSIAHHDSTGSGGVIGTSDAQWMTAASGILHREDHSREFARTGGTLHGAQIWVNLPKAHKMDPPRYQPIAADQMGHAELPNGAGRVRVIAGSYQGAKGPAVTFTPINMFDILLKPQERIDLSFPAHENTALLALDGNAKVNGATNIAALDFVLFENKGEDFTVEAQTETRLLLLNGEPIHEPAVQYGPCVMNTKQEIHEAIEDFNSGKFGYLED